MPTYEYECLECKHKFEAFQSIKDEALKECPKCGKDVRKLFSSAGIIFKGSGFYVNDYKKEPTKMQSNTYRDAVEHAANSPGESCASCCNGSCAAAGGSGE